MLKPGEVEVRVEAIGLNFRDVLNAPWFETGTKALLRTVLKK